MNFSSMLRIYVHAFCLYVLKKVPYINYDEHLNDSLQSPKLKTKSKLLSLKNNNHSTHHTYPTKQATLQRYEPAMTSQHYATNKDSSKTPTNRTPNSKRAKLASRLQKQLSNNPVLHPVDAGINKLARRIIRQALRQLQYGSITIIEDFGGSIEQTRLRSKNHTKSKRFNPLKKLKKDGVNKGTTFGSKKLFDSEIKNKSSSDTGNHPLHVTMTIYDASVYRQLLFGGSIGFADSFINGEWETDDLTGLIRLTARNLAVLNKLESRFAGVTNTAEKLKHQLRGNSKQVAKSNILAHYDLGNAMYQTFLDPRMMYSSAVYPNAESTLDEAQTHKLKLICEKLELCDTDRVIEIGTGWEVVP